MSRSGNAQNAKLCVRSVPEKGWGTVGFLPGPPAMIMEVRNVTKMADNRGAPQVCRDSCSQRSTQPWLVPTAIHKEQTCLVGKDTGSGVHRLGSYSILFHRYHSAYVTVGNILNLLELDLPSLLIRMTVIMPHKWGVRVKSWV